MMPPSLLSLSSELVCRVVTDLLIEDARSFLSCCRTIYDNGKHAFDKKCFRVLPVRLKHHGLLTAEDILKKQPCCFLEKIFIQINPAVKLRFALDDLEGRLASILIQALQASTKLDIITIHYDPKLYNKHKRYEFRTKAVILAINTALKRLETSHLKIEIQNIRVDECAIFHSRGKGFLDRVHSIAVRTEVDDTSLKPIRKILPFLTNLTEFALINNAGEFLAPAPIQECIEKINSKLLESITLIRVSTSKRTRTTKFRTSKKFHPNSSIIFARIIPDLDRTSPVYIPLPSVLSAPVAKVLLSANPFSTSSPSASLQRRTSLKLKAKTRSFNNNKGAEIMAVNS
jgi:hypothetical protein